MKTKQIIYPITAREINGMAVGETREVLLASPHTRDGYFIGYDSTNGAQQTGHGFASIDAMTTSGEAVMDNSSYIWTLTKNTDGTFSIKCNGYYPYADAEENVTWTTTQDMKVRVSDVDTIALGATTYMSTGYETKRCIRFIMDSDTTLYLNMGGNVQSLKYYPGVQEWSVWYVYEKRYEVSDDTFFRHNNSWRKVNFVYYKTGGKWRQVQSAYKRVNGSWVH